MLPAPNMDFGEHWESGNLIDHKSNSYMYWKRKLKMEITKAFSLRDYLSLSNLIRFCHYLGHTKNESATHSQIISLFLANLALLQINQEQFTPIFKEYLTKIRMSKYSYKEILEDVCNLIDYDKWADQFLREVKERTSDPNYSISDRQEFMVCQDIYLGTDQDIEQKLQILRFDPSADVNIIGLSNYLSVNDWIILVNRIDKMPLDYDSWKCFSMLLQSENMNSMIIADIRNYVGSYWPKYHISNNVSPLLANERAQVFLILELK